MLSSILNFVFPQPPIFEVWNYCNSSTDSICYVQVVYNILQICDRQWGMIIFFIPVDSITSPWTGQYAVCPRCSLSLSLVWWILWVEEPPSASFVHPFFTSEVFFLHSTFNGKMVVLAYISPLILLFMFSHCFMMKATNPSCNANIWTESFLMILPTNCLIKCFNDSDKLTL